MASKFPELVKRRLKDLKKKRPIASHHDGYGKILEEVDELWDEVRKKEKKRDNRMTVLELLDIAAACERMAEDLHLMDDVTADELWDFRTKLKNAQG
jgi:hypothetical protein